MDPRLHRMASSQGGVFTRRQCYQLGMTDDEIRPHLAGGEWRVVRRGAYVARESGRSSGPAEPLALQDRAAHLLMERPHVMSHDSAARALGIPMLHPSVDLVHVTRDGVGGSRTSDGVKHHLTRVELADTVTVDCLEVTGPARTALDLAREHGLVGGVIALDHVLARGTSRLVLHRELEVMWSWRHVRTVRNAVDLADPGAESPAETLARLLLVEMGYEVDTQWPISCHGRLFWTDLRVGRHMVEVEGVGKLLAVAEGGSAVRPTREVVRAREDRERLIRAEGLGVSRLGWDDLFGRRRDHTRRWLAAEIALTADRYGTTLPAHLAERAAMIRRRTPRTRPA